MHSQILENSQHEKQKLQNYMASNGATYNDPALLESQDDDDLSSEQPEDEELDEFNMVLQEIQERRQWLDDMMALGRGNKFKDQIRNEIAVRISKLEQLDRERTRAEAARFAVPTDSTDHNSLPGGGGRRKSKGVATSS
ncbi:hypothetical protein HDV00_008189 [Rhizophlyctis rosea]|nr:hypothetical protein HDV00_008189 [Rhizophlyctis rosea]